MVNVLRAAMKAALISVESLPQAAKQPFDRQQPVSVSVSTKNPFPTKCYLVPGQQQTREKAS
jgi:hypothetical protein